MATLPSTETLWTVEQYLRTSWSPDREFVDGRIEERNLGEKDHSILQRFFTVLFAIRRDEWKVEVFPELRTQTQARHFRIPDVCVVRAGDGFERILDRAPLIAIEIVSPEDRLAQYVSKSAEYRSFGVEHIWVIDPESREVYVYENGKLEPVLSGELTVPGTPIRVELAAMFAELDRP